MRKQGPYPLRTKIAFATGAIVALAICIYLTRSPAPQVQPPLRETMTPNINSNRPLEPGK